MGRFIHPNPIRRYSYGKIIFPAKVLPSKPTSFQVILRLKATASAKGESALTLTRGSCVNQAGLGGGESEVMEPPIFFRHVDHCFWPFPVFFLDEGEVNHFGAMLHINS